MKLEKILLALALALATGAIVSGCAQDKQPAPAADAEAVAQAEVAHANAAGYAAGQDADHANAVAHAAGVDFPLPENHAPWTPDAPLVEGMSRVRSAIADLEDQPHPEQAMVVARAADIDSAVEYMFANCKLGTEPDIALHAILARLMAGSKALHASPLDASAVGDMRAAIDNYERLFDDPNSGDDAA